MASLFSLFGESQPKKEQVDALGADTRGFLEEQVDNLINLFSGFLSEGNSKKPKAKSTAKGFLSPPSSTDTKLSNRLIRDREGLHKVVEKDTEGNLSGGRGHKLTPAEILLYPEGSKVPSDVVEEWFQQDLKVAKQAATSQIEELPGTVNNNKSFREGLESVNFQLGVNWRRKFPETWKHIIKGEFDEASDEVARGSEEGTDSLWLTQTPQRVRDFQRVLKGMKFNDIST